MRSTIDRLLIRSEELLAAPAINRAVKHLRSVNHPKAQVLAEAVAQWQFGTTTAEENRWIELIQKQRMGLRRRAEVMEIDDFGAGNHSSSGVQKKKVHLNTISIQNSRSQRWLTIMFRLMRSLQPTTVLELGTCIGISGMHLAAGLTLNGKGILVTVEGAKAYAEVASENFSAIGVKNIVQYTGRFSDVLSAILKNHQPIDFVFVDGHHNGDATVAYFEQIVPFLSRSAWMVFDDISWSTDMKRAWGVITNDTRISFAADLSLVGICHIEQ